MTARQEGQCPQQQQHRPTALNRNQVGLVLSAGSNQQLSDCSRSTQAVMLTCQDQHSSSNTTPECRKEWEQIYTRLLTAHSHFLNKNVIHVYTGVSFYRET